MPLNLRIGEKIEDCRDNILDHCGVEAVDEGGAFSAHADEVGFFEDGEVMTESGGGDRKMLANLTDVEFT